jgi:argininosuccinate lyase
VPFRETHHISGAAVKMAEDRGCALSDLTPADLRTIHPLFDDDVAAVGDVVQAVTPWPEIHGRLIVPGVLGSAAL